MTTEDIRFICDRVNLANERIEQYEVLLLIEKVKESDVLEKFHEEMRVKEELIPQIDELICKGLCCCEMVYREKYMFMQYVPREG